MSDQREPARSDFPASVRVGVVGCFVILTIGALYYARSFFLPVVLAVLVTLVLSPLARIFSRHGIPAVASAVLLVLVLGLGIAGFAYLLSDPLSHMLTQAPATISRIHDRFAFLQAPFATITDASHEFERLAGGGADNAAAPQSVVLAQPALLSWLAGTAAGIGTTFGATLILTLFLLASGETLKLKLIRITPELSEKKRSLRLLRDIENEVSHYLLTITAINVGVGVCVGLVMAILGMPDPLLWGIGAALLNFIPFVGAFTGECLALAVAAVTFSTPLHILAPPLAYLAIQLIEGNLVTPTVLGRRLELNPVAILIFLALSTWMWGIVGIIVGVPVLVVVKVFTDNFPSLALLNEFLSGETTGAEEEERPVPAHAGAVLQAAGEAPLAGAIVQKEVIRP